ncbi:MAG: M14 family zinc carboxypeptidase [Candidatus Thermoplasmatota archaeon]
MERKILIIAVILALLLSGMMMNVGGKSPEGKKNVRSDERLLDSYPFENEYPSVQQLNEWYDNLVGENPNITKKIHLGESWEGRDMWVMKVSDNVAEEEDEPSVFLHGNIHAREWSTNQVASYYLWRIVNDYGSNETITWMVNNRQIYVAPMVNPDGYIYDGNGNLNKLNGWRKNRNHSVGTSTDVGVDLNRNWDIDWESGNSDPGSNTYHGEEPFSEYETQHLRDFILSKDIDSYQDIHSHAGTLLIPWAYKGDSSSHDSWYRDMAEDMTSMTSLLGDEEEQYSYGQPDEEIGYSAPGGTIDWVYEETGAIGLCYELHTPGPGMSGFYPDEEYIMDINKDVYDSLVYQARTADVDLGDGDEEFHPPSPYIVYGTVTDDEGEPLENKEVTIENLETKETISINTDQNGYYELNFGNFVGEGYKNDDMFSIQIEDYSANFTIDEGWGQRLDIKDLELNYLTIGIEGEGTVEVDGQEMTEYPYEKGYEESTEVELKAVSDKGWDFVKWTGDYEGMEKEMNITMDEDKNITAHFEEKYDFTINIEGDGTVEVNGKEVEDGWTKEYEEGTNVTLKAIANDHQEFLQWRGDVPEYDEERKEINISINSDKTIKAIFEGEAVDGEEDGGRIDETIPGFTFILLLAAIFVVAIYKHKR